MPERKNQHFVPKWYQQYFSRVVGHIWLYKLETETLELNSIKKTCTQDWFYDKDGAFEKTLDLPETHTSDAIRKLIGTLDLENLTAKDFLDINSFLILQFSRTRDASLLSREFIDNFFSIVIQPDMEREGTYKEQGQAFKESLEKDPKQIFRYTIQVALENKDDISDLSPYLIINKTSTPFFSSDVPVIKNNCYHLNGKPLTGFRSPGLQIFCPLTDKLIFLLIHEDAYDIIAKEKSIIEITNSSDIDSFNKLQILNCSQELFLIEEKYSKYARELHRMAKKIKSNKKFLLEPVIRIEKPDGEYDEIYPFHFDGINYRFQFSFITVKKEYLKKFKNYWFKKLEVSPIVFPDRFEII